jgi:hypothetical protein
MFIREIRRLLLELSDARFWGLLIATVVIALAVIVFKLK